MAAKQDAITEMQALADQAQTAADAIPEGMIKTELLGLKARYLRGIEIVTPWADDDPRLMDAAGYPKFRPMGRAGWVPPDSDPVS